ncbi:MAG: DNA primase [Myxococcota bacterium]
MIPEEKITEIKDRVDIVQLIGEYVPLRRAGASHKGLCPFHSEKTPSFHVHGPKQYFHCFGCQVSGDIFEFLMRFEGSSFPEVARDLAERAGVTLPERFQEHGEAKQAKARQERFRSLMEAATLFFQEQLLAQGPAAIAREELARRKIANSTVEEFRLGYAPHGWDSLYKALRRKGWSPADAEELGLLVPRRDGSDHYDRFRHRLMFPVSDVHGRVVAFSGRALEEPQGEKPAQHAAAKYVNSPETPLYRKGDTLFGFHQARVAMRRETWCLVCEGNFDLIALHQAELRNSVAPMGTAMTPSQIRLLKRCSERVVLLFDADAAGKKAVRAVCPLLAKEGLDTRVASLPPGSDPDSYLRQEGADHLLELLKASPGIVEYLIDQTAAEVSGGAGERANAIASLGTVLVSVRDPVALELHLQRISRRFGVRDMNAIRRQLRQGVRADRGESRSRGKNSVERSKAPQPSRSITARVSSAVRENPLDSLWRQIFGAILDFPELVLDEDTKELEEFLTTAHLQAIFQTISRMVESRGHIDAQNLLDTLREETSTEWLRGRLAMQEHKDVTEARQMLQGALRLLHVRRNDHDRTKLRRQIEEARRAGDDERAESLTRENDALARRASQLRQSSKR